MPGEQPLTLAVTSDSHVGRVRRAARRLATSCGADVEAAEVVALAVTELATNLVRYARAGRVTLSVVRDGDRVALQAESADDGPGIADLKLALEDGYSTGGGLGDGLPAVRRLMDDFEMTSSSGGTKIVARKWLGDRR